MQKNKVKKQLTLLILIMASLLGITLKKQDVENLIDTLMVQQTYIEVSYDYTYIPLTRDVSLTSDTLNPKNIRIIDGDTFIDEASGITYRLYMVDTPETCYLKKSCTQNYNEEPNGKQAALYTQSAIKNAKEIIIEYDITKPDKYGRVLVWVFIDNQYLLQSMLAKNHYLDGYYTSNGTFTTNPNTVKLYADYVKIVQ